ncbi:MAG: TatD family nuclease-associated radical SAM protein [Bacillota bacterium]
MTILYNVGNGLYVNTTNRCPANCTFCIRNHADGIMPTDNLWLEREPTVDEICEKISNTDISKFSEIVFCGFGEPSVRLFDICKVVEFIRSVSDIPIRIDTNGLANLIHNKSVEDAFSVFDVVSISLNGFDAESYQAVTRSKFGIKSFDEMLKFASEVQKHCDKVIMTVVDSIGETAIEKSRVIANSCSVDFRVRKYT